MSFSIDFYNFINDFYAKDPNELRLSVKKDRFDFDVDFAITQIECRKKHSSKLRDFLACSRFLFPDSISAEQASHQAVARFHASLCENCGSLLDMTGGLGIDSFSFARKNINVTAIELNSLKADILKENCKALLIDKITIHNGDAVKFLKDTDRNFDIIFADPSRRDKMHNKVYNLRDCSPDVLASQELLLSKAQKVFIKASPLLDISQTIKDFPQVSAIRAVGVKDECKEILIELSKTSPDTILVEAVNLDNEGNLLWNFLQEDKNPMGNSEYATESDLNSGMYILEPSPILMKLAPWKQICKQFNAKKLDVSSHIFVSSSLPHKFPGRISKFEKVLNKQDRKSLSGFPVTVVSKNHPLSPEDIRKSFKLKEGEENFLYATRLKNKPIFILSYKIKE